MWRRRFGQVSAEIADSLCASATHRMHCSPVPISRIVEPPIGVIDRGAQTERSFVSIWLAEGRESARHMSKLKLTNTWELGAEIGSGGFGRVIRAASDNIEAAVKYVPKAPGAEREMLFAELTGVRNVVPIIDSGETKTHWILVMPLASGSLRDRMNAGSMEADEVVTVLTDICGALADLDGKVVHRDLKPENVLLLGSTWCLADFGISRYAEASTAPDTHKFALTPAYAAPERWRSERATAATDVYSVGIIAYELLTGSRPFMGPTSEQLREQHLHEDPARMQGVGSALAALVDECLYKAPSARPAAGNVLARLDRLPSLPTSPGLVHLRDANSAEVGRQAEQARAASVAQTEAERRSDVLKAARRSFVSISTELREAVVSSASAAKFAKGRGAQWTIGLGVGEMAMSDLTTTTADPWKWTAPAFEVIAHAALGVTVPENRFGYVGRSHSLWYCDAIEEGRFGWYETAFMISPMIARTSKRNPFALDPGEEAAKALWNGMAEFQTAWPFSPLIVGELEEFIDRWATWLALASEGGLHQPGSMPERPSNNWRRA